MPLSFRVKKERSSELWRLGRRIQMRFTSLKHSRTLKETSNTHIHNTHTKKNERPNAVNHRLKNARNTHHAQEVPEFSLRSVEVIVFDEADRLFEMGFAEQLRQIMRGVSEERQSLLFSATMPKQLVQFARAGLKDPALIRLDTESKISTELRWVVCRMGTAVAATTADFLRRNGDGIISCFFFLGGGGSLCFMCGIFFQGGGGYYEHIPLYYNISLC